MRPARLGESTESLEIVMTKIYKKCEKKCNKCDQCKEFAKVVKEIDLTKRSERDKMVKPLIWN